MRYFILGLLAALAVVAPVAQAEPVKTLPFVALTDAEKGTKNVKFGFDVIMSPTPSKCSGTLSVSHKISKKKTVKWTGKLSVKYGNCGTAIRGKLPKSNYGKTRKFKFKFPGSKSIKKFSSSQSFKLVPPKPIPLPPVISPPGSVGPQHVGKWFIFKKDDISDSGITFTIGADYKVSGLSRPSGLTMSCAPGVNTSVPFNWSNTSFGMGAQVGVVSSGDTNANTSNMVYSLTWNFTGPNTGTGHFSANGGFRSMVGGNFDPCSTEYDVTLSGGNP